MVWTVWIGPESYDRYAKFWLAQSGHYLDNPPPGCLFAIAVRDGVPGLFGEEVGTGPLRGLCLIGRPVARMLPQDGSIGEVTRMVLLPGLPYGTCSTVLRRAAEVATARGMTALIAYHDRTRHTGCIYKKAGFKRDGVTEAREAGWATRENRVSANYEATSKRRWRLNLSTTGPSTATCPPATEVLVTVPCLETPFTAVSAPALAVGRR